MATVRLERITKTFGRPEAGGRRRRTGAGADTDTVVAVDDVTLDVSHHEFMVLLGPSGCGKSTILRVVAGLEVPTAGEVYIGDRNVTDIAPSDRNIAMVFQSYALYPHKSVRKNIEFPLKARGVGRAERAAAAERAAGVLGLDGLLHRKPGQLSGGQRQRVALARAIVRDPAAFLMDEPLSNLDAKLRGDTRAELVDLHRRLDSTFIYVTHDQVEAMTMATLVAVVNAGRIEQVGTPQEVYDRPATEFVAQFIGTPPMNVLPDGVLGDAGTRVGIRPEHLHLSAEGPLAAAVRQVEHLGHEVLVIAEIAEGAGSGERVVVRTVPSPDLPGVGATVRLDAEQRHRHRFATATGARVP
ncbi:MAG: ABC transporter ATP-binding protein [Ilumatobacteraceae bacterium]